jgi:hypothetical protein
MRSDQPKYKKALKQFLVKDNVTLTPRKRLTMRQTEKLVRKEGISQEGSYPYVRTQS